LTLMREIPNVVERHPGIREVNMPADNTAQSEAKLRIVRGLRGEGTHVAFVDAVSGFPASLMNTAPDNVPYTFWHQIDHIRFCQLDILRYVLDPAYVSPQWPQGYWPEASASSDQAKWDKTVSDYSSDLQEFVHLVERADTDILAPVSHNAGRSILGSALMVIDHTAYHLGEFVMGRQMLGTWRSDLA
jgi:DinB family protein